MPSYTNHPKSYLFDAARMLRAAAARVTRAADAGAPLQRKLLAEAQHNITAALARIATDTEDR